MASNSTRPRTIDASRQVKVDYATPVGALAAFGLVFIAIYLGGGILWFFDFNSILIVVGGTLGATLINFPLDDFKRAAQVLRTAFFPDDSSAALRIRRILKLAQQSRKDGSLTLENDIYKEPDPFLRKCLELIVDDLPTREIRRVLEIELAFLGDRHRRGAQLFQTMGAIAPAIGLIGTLIGLVQMLQSMNDPSKIGPAMSVALLTTFYGAILANLVFLPLAGKLRARSAEEALIKELTIEGVLCIKQNINPRLIEQRLLSFIPPEQRFHYYN